MVISIVIIAVISAIAISRFGAMRSRAQRAATVSTFQGLLGAVNMYYAGNRAFPPDRQPGVFPTELQGYVRRQDFMRPPAIGGVWDWNGTSSSTWKNLGANMSIWEDPAPTAKWTEFDLAFDDGRLNSGSYKSANSGGRNYCWFLGY